MAVMIGDAWQWIPFMFVVLLVAIETQPHEQREAALVDGANRWQVFRYVTWPAIVPVSVTVILIRVIEAFKIIIFYQCVHENATAVHNNVLARLALQFANFFNDIAADES
jgi:ABC-type sugar transport system permease subunit